MKIIVGLGNPEEKYLKTFHNMGYIAVGDVASKLNVKFKKKECEAFTAEAYIDGEKVILARPVTYMNNSGRAVKQLLAKYKASAADLIVIYDDYDIPKGNIRIRPSGSAGTHNGMRNIIAEIGTQDFPRVRIGIGRPPERVPLADYVLSDVPKDERKSLADAIERACDECEKLIRGE